MDYRTVVNSDNKVYLKSIGFDSIASTLVNTNNCVGVMGKGFALEVKKVSYYV